MRTDRRTKAASPGTPAEDDDFRTFLGRRFRAAKKRNPRFSLRAFAKRLGVDHSTLSQILRGKRRLTAAQATTMGKRLGLAAEAIQAYAHDLKAEPVPRPARRVRRLTFDADTFALISIWYHSAILELTHVEGFTADSRWIARALGVPIADVNVALQRLLRLRLLEMNERSRWVDQSGDVVLHGANLADDERKRLEREPHEAAIAAIGRLPAARQIHDQMILAIDSRRLAALRTLIDNFMSDVRSSGAGRKPDEVYQVVVSLFPLTHATPTE